MSFEIEGEIVKVFETQKKTDSFQAREFVIKTDGTYPQFVKFQLTQDRCDIVEKYQPGQNVKVHFDLRGREWNEKYFTNLNAWKIDDVAAQPVQNANEPGGMAFEPLPSSDAQEVKAEDFDDLPF